jgi:hypothetical protein
MCHTLDTIERALSIPPRFSSDLMTSSLPDRVGTPFSRAPFFEEQLQAFEVCA